MEKEEEDDNNRFLTVEQRNTLDTILKMDDNNKVDNNIPGTPERDIDTSQELVSLPRTKLTKGEIRDSISKNKSVILYSSVILVSIITLLVIVFCIIQVINITNNEKLKEETKRNSINVFMNIIIFILGVFLPGPFHNFKISRKKLK